jgi:hypothetical protein
MITTVCGVPDTILNVPWNINEKRSKQIQEEKSGYETFSVTYKNVPKHSELKKSRK